MKGNKIILNAKAKDIEGNPPDTGSLLNPFREGTVEKSVRHVIDELKARY